MSMIQLKSVKDGSILYEGEFPDIAACAARAVEENINLEYADLSGVNLLNAMVDGACLKNADFTCANLTGANLSEAQLGRAHFCGAALYNTCLCYSDLSGCDFTDASFGATDIAGADLSHSRFSTLSCFSLDFVLAGRMADCVFLEPGGAPCPLSRPPIVIQGLAAGPVICLDRHIKIGALIATYGYFLDETEFHDAIK